MLSRYIYNYVLNGEVSYVNVCEPKVNTNTRNHTAMKANMYLQNQVVITKANPAKRKA